MTKLPVQAAGAFVVHHNRVLLVQRKNPPAQGKWAIPGGKVLPNETLQQAAEREILEETGISICAGKPIYSFESITTNDCGEIVFYYQITNVEAEYCSGIPLPSDDALACGWFSPAELQSIDIADTTLAFLQQFFLVSS